MSPAYISILFAGSIFVGMVCLEGLGRHVGSRRLVEEQAGARARLGAVEGAVFALLGLLIAFTFSGASARFDARRQLIVQEANCIGTAYRRIALLPEEHQAELRELLRQYVDARLDTYRKLPDMTAAKIELARSLALQDQIWTKAIAACRAVPSPPPTMLLLPALNQTFDLATDRLAAARRHPPATIFLMVAGLAFAGAFLTGDGMAATKKKSWAQIHGIGFAAIVALTAYVTLDLEFPRFGFIKIDSADQVLVEVRESMK